MMTSPRWRGALASAASAAVLIAAPLVGASTAHAQPTCNAYPPVAPELTVARTVASAGESSTCEANCFARREPVVLERHSRGVVLGRYRADRQGVIRGRATFPRRTEPGNHILDLEGRWSHLTLTTTITVTRPAHDGHVGHDGGRGHSSSHHGSSASMSDEHLPSLARTGSEQALALGGVAAGLIAVGGGTMLAVRRRRNS
jgi:hypothetical protein